MNSMRLQAMHAYESIKHVFNNHIEFMRLCDNPTYYKPSLNMLREYSGLPPCMVAMAVSKWHVKMPMTGTHSHLISW